MLLLLFSCHDVNKLAFELEKLSHVLSHALNTTVFKYNFSIKALLLIKNMNNNKL